MNQEIGQGVADPWFMLLLKAGLVVGICHKLV